MPQQWRLYLYKRSCEGATSEQLQKELGMPAEELEVRLEAARLCFEKQCLLAMAPNFKSSRAGAGL
jgi:hypothetical protein